jgi:hypothetical protein
MDPKKVTYKNPFNLTNQGSDTEKKKFQDISIFLLHMHSTCSH